VTNENLDQAVLCEGSDLPDTEVTLEPADGPQFGADLDCHQATVEIFPSAGIESGYTLQLEVLDDEGRKGMDKVKVTIVQSNV
jgi:hypothetical protein